MSPWWSSLAVVVAAWRVLGALCCAVPECRAQGWVAELLPPWRWHWMSRGDGTGPAGCFGSKGRELCCFPLGTHPSCPKYALPDCAAGAEPTESELVLGA